MSVDINTVVVQQTSGSLSEVAQKIAQAIEMARNAQTAIQSYQSEERAPQIKSLLTQLLDEAPQIQGRVQNFSEFLSGVAATYNRMG